MDPRIPHDMIFDNPKSEKVEKFLARHKKLVAEKQPYLKLYQIIGEYVMSRKQNFTQTHMPGEFLTGRIFDNTASSANHLLASSMLGALWPNNSKTFQIDPPEGMSTAKAGTEEVKQYFMEVSKRLRAAIDHPKAGFLLSLEEYMTDQGAFGTSGLSVLENDKPGESDIPVRFAAVDVKHATIAEGNDGFVDTVYIEKEFTLRQLIQEYGFENISKKCREAWDKRKYDDKVKVLHCVEPRVDYDINSPASRDMPICSIHIEVESRHILKESGFNEMPIFVSRFWKISGEVYGRSPAMETIPNILEINAMREASIIAIEKNLDPPLMVTQDGSLGGGVIDTSAGALNVRHISGRAEPNTKVIEQMVTVGELNSTYKRITELKEIIANDFFIDRLLDLNNENRMTLGEANIRNELRGQSLGTIYSRQISELFTRVIERVFNIMFSRGMLGVIPGSQMEVEMMQKGIIPDLYIPDEVVKKMVEGEDAFKVTYISPAARVMRAEELSGIQRTLSFVVEVANVRPEVLDNIDLDEVVRMFADLTGAPAAIIVSAEGVAKVRADRAKAQAQQAQLLAAESQAKIAKDMGSAAQSSAKAGIPPQMAMQGMAA